MFEQGFKGTYEEHTARVGEKTPMSIDSMMLPQNAQCPDNHSPDDMPTVAMLAPSATRSTSPALTERLFNTEHDDHETA
jgi:hypothetical protein